jgi:hypothetical protein
LAIGALQQRRKSSLGNWKVVICRWQRFLVDLSWCYYLRRAEQSLLRSARKWLGAGSPDHDELLFFWDGLRFLYYT